MSRTRRFNAPSSFLYLCPGFAQVATPAAAPAASPLVSGPTGTPKCRLPFIRGASIKRDEELLNQMLNAQQVGQVLCQIKYLAFLLQTGFDN